MSARKECHALKIDRVDACSIKGLRSSASKPDGILGPFCARSVANTDLCRSLPIVICRGLASFIYS